MNIVILIDLSIVTLVTYYTICNKQAWAKNVDPDQMLQNAASDQGLHCLSLIHKCFTQQQVVTWTCSDFRTCTVISLDNEGDLVFYIPFNITEVILRWWKGDNESFCAIMHCSKLTMSLVNVSLKLWSLSLAYILLLLLKNVSSFCIWKSYSHFFSKITVN